MAISCGIGLVVRTRPGPPGTGFVDCAYMPRSVSLLSVEVGGMSTDQLLSETSERFYAESRALVSKIADSMSIDSFLYDIRSLNDRLGLPDALLGSAAEAVRRTPGLISYYVKKRMLIVAVDSDLAQDAVGHLNRLGYPLRRLTPSETPPYVR